MGYCMQLKNESFRIKGKENIRKAFEAIKALDGQEAEKGACGGIWRAGVCVSRHYSWVNENFSKGHQMLAGIMEEWRWIPEMKHEDGVEVEVLGISFDGEKLGDDQILFDAIAPFVEPGSFIEMVGEDGCIWRWYFDGKECDEQTAELDYNTGYVNTVDYRDKFKALMADLKEWEAELLPVVLSNDRAMVDCSTVKDIVSVLIHKHT